MPRTAEGRIGCNLGILERWSRLFLADVSVAHEQTNAAIILKFKVASRAAGDRRGQESCSRAEPNP